MMGREIVEKESVNNRSYYLCTDKESDMDTWLKAIQVSAIGW
jgi:hypothetical protein